jgi:hypothetical protein
MGEGVLSESFDLGTFQEQVLASIPVLRRPLPDLVRGGASSPSDRELLEELLTEGFGRERARSELALFAASGDMTPQAKAYLGKKIEEITEAKEKSGQIVNRTDFKRHACAALVSVSNDVFAIAKVLTPVLAGLAAAGTIVVPLSPLIFGGIALGISRMGISAVCADYQVHQKAEDKDEETENRNQEGASDGGA